MESRNIYKKVMALAIPMMIHSIVVNAMVLVDNMMVGSLGTESISGVSITGRLIFVFNMAVLGGMSAPNIYSAQFFGLKDKEGFQQVFRLKLWTALTFTVAGILIFIFFGEALIHLYLTGDGGAFDMVLTQKMALSYLNIMLFGLLPFSLVQVYGSSFREMNHSLTPMFSGIISVFANIILNYILIYGKLGFPRLEVEGAAIATVLSRVIELIALLTIRLVYARRYPFLKGVFHTLRVPIYRAKVILKKGLPIFLNEFLWAFGIALLAQCYSVRGLMVIAGLNISGVLCNMMDEVFAELGSAVGILEGQFLGASRFKEAQESAMKLTYFCGGIALLLGIIVIAISGVFPMAYNTTPEVRHLATWFIILTSIFFPVVGMLNSLYFILRSGGKTLITFIFDSFFSYCVTVPLALVLCYHTTWHILLVYFIIQASGSLKMILGVIFVKKGSWITNLVKE